MDSDPPPISVGVAAGREDITIKVRGELRTLSVCGCWVAAWDGGVLPKAALDGGRISRCVHHQGEQAAAECLCGVEWLGGEEGVIS